MWDGVRNFQARNNLQAMQVGDRVLFYHSVVGTAVVGVCEVVREAYPDPTAKEARLGGRRPRAGEEARDGRSRSSRSRPSAALRDIPLVRQSRLSVMPLEKAAFDAIVKMGS